VTLAFLTKPLMGCLVSLVIAGAIFGIDFAVGGALPQGPVRSGAAMLIGMAAAAAGYYVFCLDAKSRAFVLGLLHPSSLRSPD
jgi:VIT1/CCC1 family predicted Fe2+/Mn2+ transporter